jgi:hypothetical protein
MVYLPYASAVISSGEEARDGRPREASGVAQAPHTMGALARVLCFSRVTRNGFA